MTVFETFLSVVTCGKMMKDVAPREFWTFFQTIIMSVASRACWNVLELTWKKVRACSSVGSNTFWKFFANVESAAPRACGKCQGDESWERTIKSV